MKRPSITQILFFTSALILLGGCKPTTSSSNTAADRKAQTVDPLAPYLWHLFNDGLTTFSQTPGTAGADINLSNLHELSHNGQGVHVVVSDTNMYLDHEDLIGNANFSQSKNYFSTPWINRKPTTSNNKEPHGTAVAGVIAATANNAKGGFGVAPNAKIIGYNYLSAPQNIQTDLDQLSSSVASVFNFSYGIGSCTIYGTTSAYIEKLAEGVFQGRNNKGFVYVKASGNEYISSHSECVQNSSGTAYLGNANYEQDMTFPFQIIVGALDAHDRHASYSTPGANLWITAPGGTGDNSKPGIVTTDLPGCTQGYSTTSAGLNSFDKGQLSINKNCNYTSTLSGTSFATPVVSGVVALMLQANPDLTWRDVKHILALTAKRVDTTTSFESHPAPDYNLIGHFYDRGWILNRAGFSFHNYYGFGKIDAEAAVNMALTYTNYLSTMLVTLDNNGEWLYQSPENMNLTIPNNSPAGVTSTITIGANLKIESIQLAVTTRNGAVSDLGIELTSPQGTTATITNYNSFNVSTNFDNTLLLSNAFYGESSQGTWTIKIIDAEAQDTATFESWKINVYGRAP